MTVLHRIVSVLRWLIYRNSAERDLNDEVHAFLDMAAADKVRNGAPPGDARRLAILDLGGIEPTKERVRTYRYGALLDEITRDVRYAFRMCVKTPGFTFVVVLTLALGVGANTAIFSLIDALMLRWLPVANPQDLVQLKFRTPEARGPAAESFSYPIIGALADRTEIFSGVAGFSAFVFNVGAPGSIVRVPGAFVTGAYYETLGLNRAMGRLLARDDDQRGAPLVAVISDGWWARQFERAPEVVGQTILVNGVPVTIVGVSPRGFVGTNVGTIADMTLPVAALPSVSPEAAPLLGPGNFWLRVVARPAPGVSAAQATARLATVWPQIAEPLIAPHWSASRRKAMIEATFQLTPGGTGWTYLRTLYVRPLLLLMAVAVLVLLVASANVASLLLARASARQREIAVRLAIGASRGRVVRQLVIESGLLSLMGAAVAILLAWRSGRLLVSMIALGSSPVAFDLTPNVHILGFTSIVAIVTALVFGVVPALQATAVDPSPVLKDEMQTSSSRSRVLPSLVTAQVALSLVLLVGAGLFVRTLQNLHDVDPGFQPRGVLLVDLGARRSALPGVLLDEVRRVPGVVSASLSTHTPLSGSIWSEPAVPAGQPVPERDNAFFVGAGSRFFETMQIRLLAGREFRDQDGADRPAVAIVNQRFAERFFPGQTAVGQHLSATVRGQRRDLEIVGLVANTNAAGLRAAAPATVYVAYTQLSGDFPTTMEIRAGAPIGQVMSGVRQVLQPKLPSAPIEVRALSTQVDATIVQERMMATIAGGFGLLALAIACIGLYGLLAYSVARRTKEIGIRMALGAQRSRVMGLVLGRATRLVVIGIAIGLPAAWAVSRLVESMLFGLKPADPATIIGAVVLLAVAAQIAAYVPAWRAARVDPLAALRHE